MHKDLGVICRVKELYFVFGCIIIVNNFSEDIYFQDNIILFLKSWIQKYNIENSRFQTI